MTKIKIRTFRVAPGTDETGPRVIIPPKGLLTGPGARHLRLRSGETFELPADKVDRYIRNRIKLGDLIEVAAEFSPARAAKKEG